MSNYTKSTNFATKDALASGNPLKIVKGAEIDTEFNNIATAVATKADLNSPSLVTPALGTPSSGTLTNCTGLPIDAGTTGTLPVARGGSGVTTSTGTGNNVLSNSPTLVTPVLGTPSSGTLTNCTGLPLTTGVTGTLAVANGGTGVTTSTGSGNNVLSTSPTLVTPILGTPTSGTLTNCTGLPLTSGVTGTLPVANGGTGVTTSTGSGSNVLSTSPTLVTPVLGTPTSGTLTNCTGLPLTTGVTGALPIANGGTNATSASTARSNLGLAIGSDVQAYSSNLANFSSKTAPSGTVVGTTDSQTLTNKTLGSGLTMSASVITSGSVQNTTSGTSVTFSSIPSWVKRVTLMLNGVSTNGTSNLRVRIGPSSGVETSGYSGVSGAIESSNANTISFTSGFDFYDATASASSRNGALTLTLCDSSTNTWIASAIVGDPNGPVAPRAITLGGSKSLAGALSVLTVTTVNGTDVFDSGSVNIIYE